MFKRLIRSGGMLDEKFVAGEVILPMLLTLEYLHARSIYHRWAAYGGALPAGPYHSNDLAHGLSSFQASHVVI